MNNNPDKNIYFDTASQNIVINPIIVLNEYADNLILCLRCPFGRNGSGSCNKLEEFNNDNIATIALAEAQMPIVIEKANCLKPKAEQMQIVKEVRAKASNTGINIFPRINY